MIVSEIEDLTLVQDGELQGKPSATAGAVAALKPAAQPTSNLLTPNDWFLQRYPAVAECYGNALEQGVNKNGALIVTDIREPFLAAVLTQMGTPDAPVVYHREEENFYAYEASTGVFGSIRPQELEGRISAILLECAQACRELADVRALEFKFSKSKNLGGVVQHLKGGMCSVDGEFFVDRFDTHLPCTNGILAIDELTLLPFSPSFHFRKRVNIPFLADAKCAEFLDRVVQPALELDATAVLQEFFGLCLAGVNVPQVLTIFSGPGSSSKGTAADILIGVIGQQNMSSLRTAHADSRFEQSRYVGKNLLYGADVAHTFLSEAGASELKSLTGGDYKTTERKNANEQPGIRGRFNVLITTNARPQLRILGADDASAWRRRLIPFVFTGVEGRVPERQLAEKLVTKEGPGILCWMIEGLRRLKCRGWQLQLSVRQRALVTSLLDEAQSHEHFAARVVIATAGTALTMLECYSAYTMFCDHQGWGALARGRFVAVIEDTFRRRFQVSVRHDLLSPDGKAQRGWKGLAIDPTAWEL